MNTLAAPPAWSKRAIVGGLLGLFWIVAFRVRSLPLAPEGWAAWVPLRCPLAFFFHIQCPTCGLGRALVSAALGQWNKSWQFHPLGLPIFWGSQALLLFWILWPLQARKFLQSIAEQRTLLWILFGVYGIWGFYYR